MFVPHQTVPVPNAPALYCLDGHEFWTSQEEGEVECWKCGQRSSEAAVRAALACATSGWFAECTNTRAPVMEKPKDDKDLCNFCAREMSRAYLDFYTGRDPVDRDLCRDCRSQRAKGGMEPFFFTAPA